MPDQDTHIDSPYLTTKEAAAYLRTTSNAIYCLVERGKIKPLHHGKLLRFTKEQLDAYLQREKPR